MRETQHIGQIQTQFHTHTRIHQIPLRATYATARLIYQNAWRVYFIWGRELAGKVGSARGASTGSGVYVCVSLHYIISFINAIIMLQSGPEKVQSARSGRVAAEVQ